MTRLVCRVAVFVVALGLFGCQNKTAPAPATAPAKPDAMVKAGELLEQYGTNAIAADGKYKDKIVQVTGKFSSVQKAPFIGYVVQLLPDDAPALTMSGVQ